jgi:glutathione synthase/RimK-type ligase-like ATP-grasp enzyme
VTEVALAATSATDDPDAPALVAALADVGVTARTVAWSDPVADWAGFGATVIRSTWDYPLAHEAFLQWAAGVPNLHNPAPVVAWNADKRYLDDLARAGVPTIPTSYADAGADARFPAGEVVVKPTVAGGSRGASRFGPEEHDAARAHVDAIRALGLTSMVQPFVGSVEAAGETDVVVLDGVVSHAVRKRAPLGLDPSAEPTGPLAVERCEPDRAQLAVVAAALGAVPHDGPLCYARVDLVALDDGPAVIEVELIEPFLFLAHEPTAAARLAAAVAARLG